ncbi:hypothetical protein FHW12_000324 [Dokdonella fugitiva]|uniref:DNA primase/polymerase bifunctional N-terminal domain-containing protein n=1 Tax=Dokdonella fugitiva TaxID=328517 RepID=A0A839EU47_9GAMM|nr:bifunctional DNA primase/polymerase [Dokdonella fugitiva]MBA8886133.1 hypothetical protein [Dokdonella fugitiva]
MIDASGDGRSRADYALAYAARGWAVVPLYWVDERGECGCGLAHDGQTAHRRADGTEFVLSPNSRGKHPHSLFAPHGALSASKDAATLRRWFATEPRLNIGVATGEISGIVVVDIDPRDGGDTTWADFVDRNGGQMPDTIIAGTGGGGQHVVFQYVADQVIRSPGKGVQVKGNGGYIVAEPSRHHSGGTYVWLADADPLEGATPAPAPEWLVTPKSADTLVLRGAGVRAAGYLSPQRVVDLQAAMQHLDPDPYETWFQVGMALHSTDAPEAFELWDAWSQRSLKYNVNATRRKWASFGQREGLHVESIFAWAAQAGWTGESPRVAVPAESVRVARPVADVQSAGDMGLHELPGALGEVIRYTLATAAKPQPDFAVASALALGSVIAGRRYVAQPFGNFTSLYFVLVGKSGCGKEHGRTAIETILAEAEWPELLGQSGYASDSAVFSSLLLQPTHIAFIDELGALLGNAQSEGMHYARAAMTALVESWGNCHGIMRPKAYSTANLAPQIAEAMLKRVVYNPAITLLGMTTPATFYGSLTGSAIEGGFLPRLLCVQTDIGRQPMGEKFATPVPPSVVDWINASRNHASDRGNLAARGHGAGERPTTTNVPMDLASMRAIRAYEADVLQSMDALDDEGIAELEGRSVEKVLRLACILAVSVDPATPRITADLVDHAVRYVRHWTGRTVQAVREHMHGSRFAQWQADVLRSIAKGGEKGRTERELARANALYNGLDLRQRRTVLDALVAKGDIAFVESAGLSGRGRKRQAWVAVEAGDEE